MEGGREEGREALCENYNIAIGCPCSVQPFSICYDKNLDPFPPSR